MQKRVPIPWHERRRRLGRQANRAMSRDRSQPHSATRASLLLGRGDPIEQLWIQKRAIQLTGEDRFEVNSLFCVIGKLDAQRVRPDDLNGAHLIYWMRHGDILASRTTARNKWLA